MSPRGAPHRWPPHRRPPATWGSRNARLPRSRGVACRRGHWWPRSRQRWAAATAEPTRRFASRVYYIDFAIQHYRSLQRHIELLIQCHPRLLLCIMFARTSHVVGACHSRHRHHRYHVLSCLLFWSTTRYSSPSHTSTSSHGRAHTSERCHLYIYQI